LKFSIVKTLFLALFLFASAAATQANEIKIVEGTDIRLRLLDKLSSASSVEGQRFNLEVDNDVMVDGVVAIPRGAKAVGTVLAVHKRGHIGKAGELNVQLDYVLVGEQHVRIRAASGKEGDSKVGSAVALTVLFGPLGLLKRGKDVEMNPGTMFSGYVDETVTIQ
jgi:hypothetical protein